MTEQTWPEGGEGSGSRPPEGFHKLLNQHGHGFHYAVLREAQRLRHAKYSRLYIIAECKRANPALASGVAEGSEDPKLCCPGSRRVCLCRGMVRLI